MSKIIHGDCLEVMQSMEDNSIDSIVSDPPYGISFMAKQWDKFTPKSFQEFSYQWGKEALRILKPGGYNLSFSGTRTYHRMVCGLEDAGFKIKDMIIWCYGSGFPKSLDISKAIDDYYGLERKQGEEKIAPDGQLYNKRKKIGHPLTDNCYSGDIVEEKDLYSSIPTSKEAQYWDGWGTALKPALEPIVIAQNPYENTYAENVLKYVVGGINIDGCRINYTPDRETDNRIGTDKTWGGKREASKHTVSLPAIEGMQMYKNKGRFPSNLILSHHPECKRVGSKEVKTSTLLKKHKVKEPKYVYLNQNVSNNPHRRIQQEYGLNGHDIVEAWDCHPDCPIRLLDIQSGETKSSKGGFTSKIQDNNRTHQWSKSGNWNTQDYIDNANWHNDKGGASRFFYCAKAHKSERNAGLQDIKEESFGSIFDPNGTMKTGSGNEREQKAKNTIATLKPINVMRYLVRLVTPPNGTVLDPFAGSGTTGIACIIEGFNYILIEKRKRFAEVIIPKRLEFWKDPKNWEVLKDHNILPKVSTLKKEKVNQSLGDWL